MNNNLNVIPKISIVVPCYNHGKYVMDTINSVEKIEDKSLYELIIVNDGSTDEYTNTKLKELQQAGYHVVFQQNKGLAETRNVAIRLARAEYILPLDADNMIEPEYVYQAIEIMDRDKSISVVYSDGQFFGDETGTKWQREYNLQKLMLHNTIDACAAFRKEVWESVNGYDPNMKYGLEDWEFWLHASFKGFKFHYINKNLFYYRVLHQSMIKNLNDSKIKNDILIDYLDAKHSRYFGHQHMDEFFMRRLNQNPPAFILKIIIKKYFPGLYASLVKKGKFRKYI